MSTVMVVRQVRSACSQNQLVASILLGISTLLSGCSQGGTKDYESVDTAQQAIVQQQVASVVVPTGVNYAQVAVAAASSLTVSDRVQLLGSTSGTYAASSKSAITIVKLSRCHPLA